MIGLVAGATCSVRRVAVMRRLTLNCARDAAEGMRSERGLARVCQLEEGGCDGLVDDGRGDGGFFFLTKSILGV